jgi:hypothetical protein
MAAGDIYRLVQTGTYGTTVQHALHFKDLTGTGSPSGLVTDWTNNIVPTWKANVVTIYGFSSVKVRKIGPGSPVEASGTLSGSGSVSATQYMPCIAACIVTWYTSRLGRRGRGRTYMNGQPNEAGSVGNLGTANTTRITNIANAIFNRYVNLTGQSTYKLGVFSRVIGGSIEPVNPAGFADVTSFVVRAYIGSMSTRRVGHGI